MKKVDYHIHTHFSADSEEEPLKHINEAIEHGLEEICFTDHRDIEYPFEPFELDVEAYYKEVESLKTKYADQIKIKWGLEMGLDLDFKQEINDFVAAAPFDFVIGSVHVIHKEEFYSPASFFEHKSKAVAHQEYLEAVLACINAFDCFNSLGHLDYVARYGPYENNLMDFEQFTDIINQISLALVKKEKAMEVNTRLLGSLETQRLYVYFLRSYRENGGRSVTLGTDSHIAGRDWKAVKIARELIKAAGFRDLATFTRQKQD